MKNKVILLISPEPWGRNFVSKHHYANYLAESNLVYFLNPADGSNKLPFQKFKISKSPIKDGLIQVDYNNLLPKLNNLPLNIQINTYKKQAQLIQQFLGIECFDIVWSFDPNRFFDLNVWKKNTCIYHTVDFHPTSKYERKAVESADLFLGVSNLILKDHENYRKGQLIPHAADINGFESAKKIQLPGKNKIRAIYTGNFHRHINYKLLLDIVQSNKDVDFIMVGPTAKSNLSTKNTITDTALSTLEQQENLFFMGSVPAEDLMSFISNCNINLVLFKKENERIHCSPHKLMAYFYSGNVTLSNYIDAHKDTDNSIILMCKDESQTLVEFKKIKENINTYNSSLLKEKRRKYALENSYKHRIKKIDELIQNLKYD